MMGVVLVEYVCLGGTNCLCLMCSTDLEELVDGDALLVGTVAKTLLAVRSSLVKGVKKPTESPIG